MPALPVRSAQHERLLKVRRSASNHLVTALSILSTVVVLVPLIAILGYLVYKGASSLNLAFFTKVPVPVGEEGGGMANSILGSGIVLAIASLFGIPVGIGAGVYLAEYGAGTIFGEGVRFTADVLNGVPSIVMGIAGYALIVAPQKHFSALAGGVALAIMMVPTVARTTEEMLRTVPHAVREAAFGLGIAKWRTVLSIAALPLQIYVYALSPYDEWHRLAWAGALVLIAMIMVSVTLVRIFAGRGAIQGGQH
jgi:phosphate transport system permease protein